MSDLVWCKLVQERLESRDLKFEDVAHRLREDEVYQLAHDEFELYGGETCEDVIQLIDRAIKNIWPENESQQNSEAVE